MILSFQKKFTKIFFTLSVAVFLFSAGNLLAATNLIANPSVEQDSSIKINQLSTKPVGWNIRESQTQTQSHRVLPPSIFFYPLVPGYDGSKSIIIRINKYNGDKVGWYFDPVKIDPTKTYNFSDYYVADTKNYLVAEYTLSDGSKMQVELGEFPKSNSSWKKASASFKPPKNAVSVTVIHYLRSAASLRTDNYSLAEAENFSDTTPPIITLKGNKNIRITLGSSYTDAGATATDNIDGDLTSKIMVSNPVNTAKAGNYIITYNVSDSSGNKAIEIKRGVTVSNSGSTDTTSPVITLKGNANVSFVVGTTYTDAGATATDNIDGDLTSKIVTVNNVNTSVPGTYTVTYNVSDSAGNKAAGVSRTVTVINDSSTDPDPDQTNIISNPSFENGTANNPTDWLNSNWGTNDTVFSYPVPGHTGSGASVTINSYTDGDAKWYFKEVAISPNKQYNFSDYYSSTVPSHVVAMFKSSDGTLSYATLGQAAASSSWTQFATSFVAPSSAVTVTIFHLIQSVGSLSVDDYSLTQIGGSKTFDQGMVTLSFDDGLPSFYANGVPILNSHNIKSTAYVLSNELGNSDSITVDQMLQMQAQGHEIGSHSKTHPDLTSISAQQMQDEIANSKKDLEALGANITTFAYPYGNWNSATDQIVKQAGYMGARTALMQDGGQNFKDGNPFLIKTFSIESNTAVDEMKQLIDQAIQDKAWIVFVMHRVEDSGEQYNTTPATLTAICDYINSKNVKTVTINQGIQLMAQ